MNTYLLNTKDFDLENNQVKELLSFCNIYSEVYIVLYVW